jgi:hypothetical protein
MLRNLTLSIGICLAGGASAQLTITDSLGTAQIATLLEGLNVAVSNVTTTCHARAVGEFSGVSEIPFPHGIILSSGAVDDAAGANTTSGSPGSAWTLPGDPDLDSLAMVPTADACVVEFDCVPFGDTLLFNFAFASEEYLEFVGSFNDVFAILLSGPGINGRINAATLPGGVTVSINNVNSLSNSTYYYDNEFPAGQYVTYDGFTTGLTAFAVVQPGATYHFKVAIADAIDQIFDSAVLLEAFSFRSVDMSTRVPAVAATPLRIAVGEGQVQFLLPGNVGLLQGRVLDATGSLVKSFMLNGDRGQLSIAGLSPGAYAVVLDGAEGRIVGRFVQP